MDNDLQRLAELLQRRNVIDAEIGGIIQRPASVGHLGEWIAAKIFKVRLEPSAVQKAWDGHFMSGPLMGRTVNIK